MKRSMQCWHKWRGVVLALLLVLPGCPHGAVVPVGELKQATADQLASLLRSRAEATQSAKGLFRAQIKGPGLLLPARVDGTVFYSRPDSMRVRGFSLFGGELFELVVNQDLYRLTLPTERKELKGQASELGTIGKYGRPVELSLLAVHAALGLTTVRKGQPLGLVEDGDRYRLEVSVPSEAGGLRVNRRIWFDRRTLLMSQEEWLSPAGEVEVLIRYEDYRSAPEAVTMSDAVPAMGPILRPYRIVMEDGRGRGSVHLTFQEIMANVPIKPEELGTI